MMQHLKATLLGSASATLLSSLLTYCLLSLGFTLTERIYTSILVLLPVVAVTGALIGLGTSYVTSSGWIVVVSAFLGWIIGVLGGAALSVALHLPGSIFVWIVLVGVIAGLLVATGLGRLTRRT